MSHEFSAEQLAGHVAGELDPALSEAIERAAANDADLRARIADIRATDALLANLPAIDPPAHVSAALARHVDDLLADEPFDELGAARKRRTGTTPGPSRLSRLMPVAAAAVAVLLGAGIVGNVLRSNEPDQPTAALEQQLDTAAGTGGDAAIAESGAFAPALEGPALLLESGEDYDDDALRELGDRYGLPFGFDSAEQAEEARVRAEVVYGYTSPRDEEAGTASVEDDSSSSVSSDDPDTSGSDTSGSDGTADSREDTSAEVAAAPQASPSENGPDAEGQTSSGVTRTEERAPCIEAVLDAEFFSVPLLYDRATFQGSPAAIIVVAEVRPDSGSLINLSAWVVDLAEPGCQILRVVTIA